MNDGQKQPVPTTSPYDSHRIYDVPMSEIFADSEFNVRGHIDPTDVAELAKEIATSGTLLSPIIIQPYEQRKPYKFRILAGHRRHAAYKLLQWKVIPSIIKENVSQAEAWGINLRENIHRKSLNVLQEAHGIEHLKDMGVARGEIARIIGKSGGWVQERTYLLEMPDDIQRDAAAGVISLKHIRNAWSLQSVQQQREYIKSVKEAQIKKKVRPPVLEKFRRTNEKRLRTKEEVEALQDTIRETFGNGLATRALGWAIGYNSDLEIHQFLAEQARLVGKFHMIPPGLGGHAKVTESPDDAAILDIDAKPTDTTLTDVPEDDSDIDDLIAEAKNAS